VKEEIWENKWGSLSLKLNFATCAYLPNFPSSFLLLLMHSRNRSFRICPLPYLAHCRGPMIHTPLRNRCVLGHSAVATSPSATTAPHAKPEECGW
jgi:hypothetical protein